MILGLLVDRVGFKLGDVVVRFDGKLVEIIKEVCIILLIYIFFRIKIIYV